MHRWHFLPEGYLSRRSAAGYDRVIRNVYNAFSEHQVIREVVRRIRAFSPASVLEVAPGPGRLMERLARLPSVTRLTGVELSPYLLERAASRISAGPARLVHGDGLALPLAEAEVDLATASHYVGHLPATERRRAVAEMARVVRPGGHVVAVDHRWHPWPSVPSLREVDRSSCAFGAITLRVLERIESEAAA